MQPRVFPFLLSDLRREFGVCREGLWTRPYGSEKPRQWEGSCQPRAIVESHSREAMHEGPCSEVLQACWPAFVPVSRSAVLGEKEVPDVHLGTA